MKRLHPGWSRRSLIVPALLALTGGAATLAWRLFSPPPSRAFGGLVRAGRPQDYGVGDVKTWADGRFYMAREASVIRRTEYGDADAFNPGPVA